MAYNALGQRTQLARFQSTGSTNPVATTDYTYDTANRLSGIAHKQGTTNLNSYAYTYDPLSRLKTATSTLDGLTSYTHSQNDQLLGAVNTGVPNESFGYDANGNRNTTGYTTSSDNRMTASPGFTYLYDAEGNLTRKTNTATGNYTTYTWDHRNRLTQVAERTNLNSLVSEINYEYDAFNRLSRRYPTSGSVTYWVYDGGINPVFEYNTSASPSMTHRYLWSDNVDELLADEQNPGLSSMNTLWALSDHLGSIRDIADTNESTGITSIANHRRYDSTGKRISETNASVDMVFGYTGKLLDETTGLQNNLNRWLDPATGRWISQDPIGFGGGDANLYRYVGNEPTNATDPSGLFGIWDTIVGWFATPVAPLRDSGGNGNVDLAKQNVFMGRTLQLDDPSLRRESAQERQDAANNAADFAETMGDAVGVSPLGRLVTGEHLNGAPVTNGEVVMDGLSVGSPVLGALPIPGGLPGKTPGKLLHSFVHGVTARVGGGATTSRISSTHAKAIQEFAERYNVEVAVVGSRVNPAKEIVVGVSDWDYVINAIPGQTPTKPLREIKQSATQYLPKGSKRTDNFGNTRQGLDVETGVPVDESLPHVIFTGG